MIEPRPPRPCPVCGRPQEQSVKPFCSKRCADVDLHRWLGGHYAIPIVEEDGAEGAGQDQRPPETDNR